MAIGSFASLLVLLTIAEPVPVPVSITSDTSTN